MDVVNTLNGKLGGITLKVVEISTSGKTLNTVYTEDMPSGYTAQNTIILGYSYYVFGNAYSYYSMTADANIKMEVHINASNKIEYTPMGTYTERGTLKVVLAKYA